MSNYLDYLVTPNDILEMRMHEVALDALAQFDVVDAGIEAIHESSIALIGVAKLRITPPKGTEKYLLCIHCRLPYWGVNASKASIASYLDWLLYLHRDTDLTVQEPLPNRAGDLVAEVQIPKEDEPLYATLHRWVEGEDLPEGDDQLERVGALLAELHTHASNWDPPRPFARPEYTSEDLYAPLAFLQNASAEDRISRDDISALSQAADRVAIYLDNEARNLQTWGVIHGDFNNSCVLHEGELCPIDFDDCCLGFYIADIGNTFKGSLGRDPGRAAAFLDGYQSVNALPDNHVQIIEGFIIAAWIRNWARWREPNQTFYNLHERVSNECKTYLSGESFLGREEI